MYKKLYCKVEGEKCLGFTLKIQNRKRFFREVVWSMFWVVREKCLCCELGFGKQSSFERGKMEMGRGHSTQWKE